jgi:hypothetical protein
MKIEYETNTLVIIVHDKDNLYLVYNTLEEIERLLCKKLDVEEDEDGTVLVDVDDYYEFLTLRRKVLDYCPIY